MSGNAEACRAHNGWGCFITGENVTRPSEGVFLPVYMDRCEDLTGRPFEHVTPAPADQAPGPALVDLAPALGDLALVDLALADPAQGPNF